ncbi:DUF397 domain-containing protein [Kitasatospora sp. NPDC088548]|uniref:DUF397 domain-containing protein n=1 Tax=Kitasatospora sp. NPDC088548 TaxID=3364075 RepID=UPI00381CE685
MTNPDFTNAHWFKARASESAQGCFEVAHQDGYVGLRDSKDLSLPAQVYPADVWASWLEQLRTGVFTGHRIRLTFVLGAVVVSDSATPTAQVHTFTDHEFRCFMSGVRCREFDLAA